MASPPSGQADGMGVLRFYKVGKVFVLNNFIDNVNSVRWLQIENYQRRSLAPIR
jgi:hypothetical protein